jgi:hypothetical protein
LHPNWYRISFTLCNPVTGKRESSKRDSRQQAGKIAFAALNKQKKTFFLNNIDKPGVIYKYHEITTTKHCDVLRSKLL